MKRTIIDEAYHGRQYLRLSSYSLGGDLFAYSIKIGNNLFCGDPKQEILLGRYTYKTEAYDAFKAISKTLSAQAVLERKLKEKTV